MPRRYPFHLTPTLDPFCHAGSAATADGWDGWPVRIREQRRAEVVHEALLREGDMLHGQRLQIIRRLAGPRAQHASATPRATLQAKEMGKARVLARQLGGLEGLLPFVTDVWRTRP